MKMARNILFSLIYFSSILTVVFADEVTIQLYKHHNFTGLLWESNSTEDCTNIPKTENANVYSIITDTCFIAYHDPDCKSRWSMKYMPGDINLSEYDIGRDGRIRSFHTCTDHEGGDQLNVDITKYYTFSYLSSFVPDVLQSYKNVCSCVNVPQCVQNMDTWSINNHHNDLVAYYEPNCTENKWDSKHIPAGHSMDSRYMHDHLQTDSLTKTAYKIQSFGPNPDSIYYQSSCMPFHLATKTLKSISTENPENYESVMENVVDVNTDVMDEIRILSYQNVELQKKIEQLEQNLEDFKGIMWGNAKQQNDNFIKFTEKIENYFRNIEGLLTKLNMTCANKLS